MFDAQNPNNPDAGDGFSDTDAVTPALLTPYETVAERRRAWRRRGFFGLGAVGFCAAGLLVGSQLAGGGTGGSGAAAADTPAGSAPASSPWGAWMGADGGGSGGMGAMAGMSGMGAEFAGVAQCMATELGVDISGGMGPEMMGQLKDIPQEKIEAAWTACAAELPAELTNKIDAFQACFKDMEPRTMGSGDHSGPMGAMFDGNGAVAVMTPSEQAVHSFGEGDGSITVTKTGDSYSVTSTGDVSEAQIGAMLEDLGDKMHQVMPGLQDRLQECGIELPPGMAAPAGS